MNRDVLETALKEGIPFVIKMSDGDRHVVKDRFGLALGRTRAVIFDDRDQPQALMFGDMTGVSYLTAPTE